MTTTVVAAALIALVLLAVAWRGSLAWRDVLIVALLVLIVWLGREVGRA